MGGRDIDRSLPKDARAGPLREKNGVCRDECTLEDIRLAPDGFVAPSEVSGEPWLFFLEETSRSFWC